jgi:amino acid transporter
VASGVALPDNAHSGPEPSGRMSVHGAAFVGVGAMVGAGIFSLLAEAGAYAGAALWISFLLAGGIALLQGYSFAHFGARYPSGGGLMEYVRQGFGNGHIAGIIGWLVLGVNIIVTSLVAVSFGTYVSDLLFGAGGSAAAVKLFAVAVVAALAVVNMGGAKAVEVAQNAIVWPLIGVLAAFSLLTLVQADRALLAPSTYPPAGSILSGVGLAFFAFLGFAIVSFTAGDLENPQRELPRAMYMALGITTVLYIGVSLGVYGTLTPQEVQAAGATALAVAAEPILGQAGYLLMAFAALLATSSSVNAGLYPTNGFSVDLAAKGQVPALLARPVWHGTGGLVVTAVLSAAIAAALDLSAIADVGSAMSLLVFLLISAAHLRVFDETGAKRSIILLGAAVTALTLVYFFVTVIVGQPVALVATLALLGLAVGVDFGWKAAGRSKSSGLTATRSG